MDKKRDRLSDAYSQALQTDADTVVAKTGGAAFADYAEDDLQGLPDGIEAQSFGCGNPLAFSDVQPGDTVVDLGCGAGLDLLIAAEKVGETGRVIGVDFNRDMLALAESRTRHLPTVELRHGTIEALPIATGSVDWVISNCVINLSNDKQRAFDEIARVLKPDGHMLVSDIVADALPWWVRRSGVLRAACGGGVISEAQYVAGVARCAYQACVADFEKPVERENHRHGTRITAALGVMRAFDGLRTGDCHRTSGRLTQATRLRHSNERDHTHPAARDFCVPRGDFGCFIVKACPFSFQCCS